MPHVGRRPSVWLSRIARSVMLGTEAVRRYYEWQLVGPHEVTAISAYINTELVGFCFGGNV